MTFIAPLITANPQTITGGTYARLASLINTGRWRIVVTPTLGSVAFVGGAFHVIFGQANGGLAFVNATIEMDDSPSDATMFSQPLTWSAGQTLTFTIDTRAATRSVTIAGATTGNGTFTYASGNTICAAGTNLEIGAVGGSSTFAGTISSFDDTAPDMSWSPQVPAHQLRRPAGALALGLAAMVGPVAPVPPPVAPPLSWAPQFPDFAPAARRPLNTGGEFAPTTIVPAPVAPQMSWTPAFPDLVPRARSPVNEGGAVGPVTVIPQAAAPLLSWAPVFPDIVPRARAPIVEGGICGPEAVIPQPPAPPLSWAPSFPDAIPRARRAIIEGGAIGPTTAIPNASGAPGLGVAAWRQKANTTAPTTGTLTTLAVYPAWTPSTGYTILLDARVTNGGNGYECATSGTSASSGGPTGTPAPVSSGAITDGTAKWNTVGVGTGAFDTQATGSLFLVSLGRGADHSSGTAPRDSHSNTYALIGSKAFFAGFPNSSAATWASALPAAGGVGHTISADWGAGDDGGGDEISIMGVEVIGGLTVHDHSSVEATPVSNVCTSNSVKTTGPAVLVCFCWLNGGTHPDGFLHVATPGSGFSFLGFASGLLEIGNTAGQVQGCVIAKTVNSGGTYTASITTAAGEGAIMQLIAIQGSLVDVPSIAGWAPGLPDLITQRRGLSTALGLPAVSAPILTLPSVAPLSWAPTFPDVLPRAARQQPAGETAPPSFGDTAKLLAWLPSQLELPRRARWNVPAGEIAPPPPGNFAPAPWGPSFPDIVLRAAARPPSGEVAPAFAPSAAAPPVSSWSPQFPDVLARPTLRIQGGEIAPTTTPAAAPVPPIGSWSPTFPHALARAIFRQAAGEVAPVAIVPPPAVPSMAGWVQQPVVPVPRARRAPPGEAVGPVMVIPQPPAPPLWSPVFPDFVRRARTAQPGGEVAPVTAALNLRPALVRLAPVVTTDAHEPLVVTTGDVEPLTVTVEP